MTVVDNINLLPLQATIEVYRGENKIFSGTALPGNLQDEDIIIFSHAGYYPLQVRYRDIKGFGVIELERNDLLEPVIVTPKKKGGILVLLLAAFILYKIYK